MYNVTDISISVAREPKENPRLNFNSAKSLLFPPRFHDYMYKSNFHESFLRTILLLDPDEMLDGARYLWAEIRCEKTYTYERYLDYS